MPTPAKGFAPRGEVAVVIELDPEGKNIVVTPDPFWVHISDKEEVKWFCSREHKHGAESPCFKVDFEPPHGSPFTDSHFEGHRKGTGVVRAGVSPCPAEKPSYKYTVTVKTPTGTLTKDPTGGVKA